MAKNWTVVEALEALKNFDKAAIMDFGKRFPLATNALAKATNVEDFVAGLPEHVTMRKIDANLKEGVEPYVDEDEEGEAPKKSNRGRKPKVAKTEDEKKAAAKARREARKAKKAAEAVEEDDEDEVDEDEPEDISTEEDYSSMNALELFKLCKKRGIKTEPKQKSSVYIKLLKAADATSDEDEADDDWSDDEEEEEAPAPAPKKGRGRPAKAKEDKPAKKPTPAKKSSDEDDDDDWDI